VGTGAGIDAVGDLYVTGYTKGGFPTTPGAYHTVGNGSQDAFVTRLRPSDSSLVYSTYLGGSSFEEWPSLLVTPAGNAYLCGGTAVKQGAQVDAFVGELDPSGSTMPFYSSFGGSLGDWGSA